MKSKKLLSLGLSLVMSLSLAVPAFAAANTSNTTEISGAYKEVTIAVDVPATGKAFINPYGLDLKVPQAEGDSTEVTIKGQQIVSAPMAIKNKSAMDLSVSATVTGKITPITVPDGQTAPTLMKFATGTTKGSGTNPDAPDYVAPATGKSAYVYFQAKQATNTTGTVADIATEYAAWGASAYDEDTDVIVAAKAVAKENVMTLRAADLEDNGTFKAFKAGSIGMFRLTGDCTSGSKANWTDKDQFTVTVAFTFTPAAVEKYAVTVSPVGGTGTTTGVNVAADYATAAEGDEVTISIEGVTVGNVATITVTGANGDSITVTPASFTSAAGATDTTATFTMPAQAVTVTVTVAAP